jgi:hypothetical protein
MFGSGILDVAIGIIFLYLLLSLICSSLTEGIARILALRSSNLLNAPEDDKVIDKLYNHPLIKGLYRQGWFDKLTSRAGKPSYIPARTFASALLDILAPPNANGRSKTFDEVRDAVNQITDADLKKVLLLSLNNANGELDKVRQNIENCFNDAMERVYGWYKRKTQIIILAVALVISIALNADTLTVANSLWNDTALRESLVAVAQRATEQSLSKDIGEIKQQLAQLQFPLGWQSFPSTLPEWLAKAFGLLFTAAALALGAPFWFDVLNKAIRIRSTGESPSTHEH